MGNWFITFCFIICIDFKVHVCSSLMLFKIWGIFSPRLYILNWRKIIGSLTEEILNFDSIDTESTGRYRTAACILMVATFHIIWFLLQKELHAILCKSKTERSITLWAMGPWFVTYIFCEDYENSYCIIELQWLHI